MFEQWLYRRLITSPKFHYYVRIVHALMNDLPPPNPPNMVNGFKNRTILNKKIIYKPTVIQRFNAYFKIWRIEMTDTFLFKK
ncbi:hypothetical protein C6P40_000168 [Pichia californica]|uniref:Uncharacterized protein n=1 Tax=Pichia californica TaxID=460514 RepID=A0A9P6WLC1_9ASCO|nr:hypothetical protein C6P42_003654 [[Candida] californica]KAG0689066.1 hypothetical protein C6P40_000168 [[Candida] californica]